MYKKDTDRETVRTYKHSEKLNLFWNSSDEMCLNLSKNYEDVLLSFSLGKDSIVAATQVLRYFKNVQFVYMYDVPNLEFVNNSIEYYNKFFGLEILQLPAPTMLNRLFNFAFQTPNHTEIIDSYYLPFFDDNVKGYNEIFKTAANFFDMDNYLVADGVRAEDTLNHWTAIKKTGAFTHARRQFKPCYDWGVEETFKKIKSIGAKLPIDYKFWGRTFDGVDYKFLKEIKENFPKDYQKILEYYQFMELEILRYENPKTGRRTENLERNIYLNQ